MFELKDFERPKSENGCVKTSGNPPAAGVHIRNRVRNRAAEGKITYEVIRIRIGHDVLTQLRWQDKDRVKFLFRQNGALKMAMMRDNKDGDYSVKTCNGGAKKTSAYVEVTRAFLGAQLFDNIAGKYGQSGMQAKYDVTTFGLLVHLDTPE